MELRHLRCFVAVVEAGTVSAAAERLRLTQPALSRQLRHLQSELGLALFERAGRNLHLTAAGEDLLAHARRVLNDADAFRERVRSLRRGDAGVLRVGASPQMLARLSPALLDRFGAMLPGVDVRFTEGNSTLLLDLLRSGALHLALMPYQPELRDSVRLLGATPLLAVSCGRQGSALGTIEARELSDSPLLLLRRGFGSRDLFDAACHLAHIRPLIILESGSPHTMLALVRAGRGTAILPATTALNERGLIIRQVTQDGTRLQIQGAVHWNPQRHLPPYAEQFVDEVERGAREEWSRKAARSVIRWLVAPEADGPRAR